MSEAPDFDLPNPLTPMAFFPPDLARQITISHYIYVSAVVLVSWEMLNNVSADLKLLRLGLNVPMLVYFLSRFSTLAFLLGITILHTTPVGNCAQNGAAVIWLWPVQAAFTSHLFYVRVQAMYRDKKWARPFFFITWLFGVAACTSEAWSSTTEVKDLAMTGYCYSTELSRYTIIASAVPFVYETVVFFAISSRLASVTYNENTTIGKDWMKAAVFGNNLPAFSRGLLKDGQLYYLAVVLWHLAFMILFYIKSASPVIRWTIGVPGVALVNIMACRVYRNTKFGIYRESTSDIGLPTISTRTLSPGRRSMNAPLGPMTFAASIPHSERSANAIMQIHLPGGNLQQRT